MRRVGGKLPIPNPTGNLRDPFGIDLSTALWILHLDWLARVSRNYFGKDKLLRIRGSTRRDRRTGSND